MEGDLGLELREKSLGTDLEEWACLPSISLSKTMCYRKPSL